MRPTDPMTTRRPGCSVSADHPVDVSSRRPVSLPEVLARAAQLVRVDRKYLLPVASAQQLVDRLPEDFRLLTFDGRRSTTYRSTYFDTADLGTARAHVQRRRRRWKARSRLYVEDGLCRVEVKTKDGRGVTIKSVADSTVEGYAVLGPDEGSFVEDALRGQGISCDLTRLGPTMEVDYRRATLASLGDAPARVTIDWGMTCVLGDRGLQLDRGHVLVETKGGAVPGQADRLLARIGARPRPFSKYAAAASLLVDDLPDNDVRRLRGRLLHVLGETERLSA